MIQANASRGRCPAINAPENKVLMGVGELGMTRERRRITRKSLRLVDQPLVEASAQRCKKLVVIPPPSEGSLRAGRDRTRSPSAGWDGIDDRRLLV